jgi:YD repeat-containing protein
VIVSYNHDLGERLTASSDGAAYAYCPAGILTLEHLAGFQTGYVYDGENRLTKLTNPDGTFSTYTYAGGGLRRTAQDFGGTVHTMVWDGSDYLGEVR